MIRVKAEMVWYSSQGYSSDPEGVGEFAQKRLFIEIQREEGSRSHRRVRNRLQTRRSLFFVAPPMNRLDVIWMIVPPRPFHPPGMEVVGHDVAIVCERLLAEGAYTVLGD